MNKKETVKNILISLKNVINFIDEIPKDLSVIFEEFYEEQIDEETALSLLVIISNKPKQIEISPYLTEHILDLVVENKIDYSRNLLLTILNCLLRIFLARPGETLPVLSRFYQFLFSDNLDFTDEVKKKERASVYYNMLKNDVY